MTRGVKQHARLVIDPTVSVDDLMQVWEKFFEEADSRDINELFADLKKYMTGSITCIKSFGQYHRFFYLLAKATNKKKTQ